MLPGFRFMIGAALGSLLLILTLFGFAATVRIAQQATIAPLEPSHTLAYADPADWEEFYSADIARRFDAMRETGHPRGAQMRNQPLPIPVVLVAPIARSEERPAAIPSREVRIAAIPSIAAAGEERAVIADPGPAVESKPLAPLERPVEPSPADQPAETAKVAGLDAALVAGSVAAIAATAAIAEPAPAATAAAANEAETATAVAAGPVVEPLERVADLPVASEATTVDRGAGAKQTKPATKATPKPKRAARERKPKKRIAKRKAPRSVTPPVAATGLLPSPGTNQTWMLPSQPASQPAISPPAAQRCGAGSATAACRRALPAPPTPGQPNFPLLGIAPLVLHPQ